MKLLAVADIHGRESSIRKVIAACTASKVDMLVIAGDITGNGNTENIYASLDSLKIPVMAVPGNVDAHDPGALAGQYRNIRSLHLRKETLAGIPFVGWGGGLGFPFVEKFLPGEKARQETVAAMLQAAETVLVTHVPPWGVLDSGFASFHGGSKALRRLVENSQPRLLICGHIHEHRGIARLGNTHVVNCSMGLRGSGAVIDLPDDGGVEIEFL